jgi:YbgC/YbaW family acyl-CoA thioester hydrolase
MIFIHTKRIYGYECDIYGHLNNANYLQIYEAARAEALLEMNMPIARLKDDGLAIFVIKAEISFKKGVELEDTITVKSKNTKLDRLNSVWEQEIYNSKNELCNKATISCVFVSNGKPTRISNEMYEYFLKKSVGE